MNLHWHNSGPVVIGGVGGSGTRLVAALLQELGFFLGSDLNAAMDNLWFTLLFKRRGLVYKRPEGQAKTSRGLSLFEKLMKGRQRPTWPEYRFLLEACTEVMLRGHDYQHNGRGIWPLQRLTKIMRRTARISAGCTGWGWKEPNTHIFIEHLAGHFRDMKYIHVIRNGLDMAFSNNQSQLYNWAELYRIEKPCAAHSVPAASLAYWIAANRRAVSCGTRLLGERFLLLNYDDLLDNPGNNLERLVTFLAIASPEDIPARLGTLIKHPASRNRYRLRDLSSIPPDALSAVTEFGFTIATPGNAPSRSL